MKKSMKKGSLLIVWSLLLAMMFGMSVHAGQIYKVQLNVGDAINSNYDLILSDRVGDVIVFNEDCINIMGYSLKIVGIDGTENEYIGTMDDCIFPISGKYKVTGFEPYIGGQSIAGQLIYGKLTLEAVPDPAPAPGEPAPEKEEDKHEHNWEWIQIQAATDAQDGVEVMCCTECGQQGETRKIANSAYGMFCNATADKISKAAENATVEMETEIWSSLPKSVMDAIKERRDLTVNLTLTYQNKKYPLSIPAGYDMSVLEEADWYGVLYLNQFFGVANQ